MDDLPTRSDAPTLFLISAAYLILGLIAIFRPDALRRMMDGFADFWRPDSWHPYKMPRTMLQIVVGGIAILVAALFAYFWYIAINQP